MTKRYGFALAPFKSEGASTPYDMGASEGEQFAGEDKLILPSGREFYANCGIVGIDAKGGIFEGYDGGVDIDLTDEERRSLAGIMIDRWRKFGESHSG
jgi:hypothetical protein